MKIGIIGLPNVGKSTLFKTLTKKEVNIANYPFCTIDPNVGIVTVPDKRLEILAKLSNSKKIVETVIEFVDIAGLVKDAHQGQGLGNKFLSHIREVDAIVEVVRIFEDENIIHVSNKINPLDDIETIDFELIFSDLDLINKRLEKLGKELRSGDKKAILEKALLENLKTNLEKQKPIISLQFKKEEEEIIKSLNLMTVKPKIYAFNKSFSKKNLYENNDAGFLKLIASLKENGQKFLILDANSGENINELIALSYQILSLITFLTTGEDETRAWTILKGSLAPIAGRAIHSDFEKKFIKAEVISFDDLVRAGSLKSARQMGLIRIEGKEYVVKDGDVIEFKV